MVRFLEEEAAALLSQSARGQSVREDGPPIDDLVLWLDASRGVYTNDDDEVTKWFDRSGGGHHAEPKGDPVLISDGLWKQPVVRFDDGPCFLYR